MSISELFVPNPYPINAGEFDSSLVNTQRINSILPIAGNNLIRAETTAGGAIHVGQTGSTTTVQIDTNAGINGGLTVNTTAAVALNFTDSATIEAQGRTLGIATTIAAPTLGVNIGTVSQPIVMKGNTITIGDDVTTPSTGVILGGIATNLTFPKFSGQIPHAISGSIQVQTFNIAYTGARVDGGGCRISFFKMGNWVTMNVDSHAPPLNATAALPLIIYPIGGLPAPFRPLQQQTVICSLQVGGPPPAGTGILGVLQISAAGVVQIIVGAATNFIAGALCGVLSSQSITYPVF